MNMTSLFGMLGFLFAFYTPSALALPIGDAAGLRADLAPEIDAILEGVVDFRAIVGLNNCSGSLVRFNTSLPSDPALVLTNGHCYERGFLKPGEVKVNDPSMRSFTILARDGKTKLGAINATRLLYATMTGTDMALYETRETFDALEKRWGVLPLTLSATRPTAGRSIAIASGYWRKIYSCNLAGFVWAMREGAWSWTDSIRFSQPGCETIGGTSGSPIIDTETYDVVGVNNTGVTSGAPCAVNNPCEVDEFGKATLRPGGSYGQQTYWIYSCLSPKNEIDLSKDGCLLSKPQK